MFSTQTGSVEGQRQRVSFGAAFSEGDSDTVNGGEGESDATLEDVAEHEHEYLRGRLRDELQREPTEEELDEWLREHTEAH